MQKRKHFDECSQMGTDTVCVYCSQMGTTVFQAPANHSENQ